jgi:hypothetical protein
MLGAVVVVCLVSGAGTPGALAAPDAAFMYTLSNFSGPVPYNWGRVFVDKERNETYVLYKSSIRVFNQSGMEIYRFGDDSDLGHIIDAAVDVVGNIVLLTDRGAGVELLRCDFRGEPVAKLEIKNLPPEYSAFSPNRIICREGRIFLADLGAMKVIVTTADAKFEKGYDIAPLLELTEKEKAGAEIVGFSVDRHGNILFTIPVIFKAFRLSADGELTFFGESGSAPGRFGVVSGIIADNKGNYMVADKLKNTVMVFDENHKFLLEFGYRGAGPGGLSTPGDLAIDGQDRVYVTQGGQRGVNVYRMNYQK